MLNPKLLREDFEGVKEQLKQRGLPENFDSWQTMDLERRGLLQELETIRAEKNSLNPKIAELRKAGEDSSALISELKAKGEREKELTAGISKYEQLLSAIELILPNLPHASVPDGKDESSNREEKVVGSKPEFDFNPRPHWEIGEKLDILDFERGAKLSGARFVVYKALGARLERALINFMLETHGAKGYSEIIPPLLVREETMLASGQLPKFAEDAFRTTGTSAGLYLIPTAEVALVNLYRNEILNEAELPLNFAAYSPCFRAEAGSHGRDVRGLIRLHQFNKVELVKIVRPEESYHELEKLTSDAEEILEKLGLCYRRVTLSKGDMGLAAAKTYDLEVWLPGQDSFREISSCSNTTDFQSRRAKVRYRSSSSGKPELVHMLNGSGLAVGRTVVAILENYQCADGSVEIPEVLRPYMNGLSKIAVS